MTTMEKRIFENFAEIKIQEDEQEIMIVYITKDTFTKHQAIIFENLNKDEDISGILKKMDIFPQKITVQGKDISKILNLNFIMEYLKECQNPFMEVELVRANLPKIGIIIKKDNIQVIAKSMIFDVNKGTVLPMTSIKTMYEDLEDITKILKELKNSGIWKLITGKDE
jgi:hypothetical protein